MNFIIYLGRSTVQLSAYHVKSSSTKFPVLKHPYKNHPRQEAPVMLALYVKCLLNVESSGEQISENGDPVEVLFESDNHNHTPGAASIEKKKIMNKVKETSLTTDNDT